MITKFKNLDKKNLFERPKIQPLTRKKADEFLECIAQGDSVSKAAKVIGFTRRAMMEARVVFEDFKDAWDDAIEAANDLQEDRLWELSLKGWGPATIVWLKAHRPDLYAAKLVSPKVGASMNNELMAQLSRMEQEEEDDTSFKTEIVFVEDTEPQDK